MASSRLDRAQGESTLRPTSLVHEALLRMRGRREEAEQYLALFCEKSEIEPHYIRRWMPLVAASQTVVANARSRAVLQRWIDDPAGAQEMETEVNEA